MDNICLCNLKRCKAWSLAVRLQFELLLEYEDNSSGCHLVMRNYNFSVNTKPNPNDDNDSDIYHLQQQEQ